MVVQMPNITRKNYEKLLMRVREHYKDLHEKMYDLSSLQRVSTTEGRGDSYLLIWQ